MPSRVHIVLYCIVVLKIEYDIRFFFIWLVQRDWDPNLWIYGRMHSERDLLILSIDTYVIPKPVKRETMWMKWNTLI